MGLNTAVLERQLARAREQLAACEKLLKKGGVGADALSDNTQWRRQDARRRQITRRLRRAEAVAKLGQPSGDEGETSEE